jgi:hypothetical protein
VCLSSYHLPLDHANTMWSRVQIMKLLIMKQNSKSALNGSRRNIGTNVKKNNNFFCTSWIRLKPFLMVSIIFVNLYVRSVTIHENSVNAVSQPVYKNLLFCKLSGSHLQPTHSFFLICISGGGIQTGSTRHVGHLLAYCTCPG